MFLMDAAKKTDQEFNVKPKSSSHTTLGSTDDVQKMMSLITDKAIISEDTERQSPSFIDYTAKGFDLMCKPGWIEGVLQQDEADTDEQTDTTDNAQVDLDYELYFN